MGQDLQATILRPSIVFGPGMPNASLGQLITLVDRRLFFYVGPKGASANYVPVENVIDAMVLCGHSPKAPGEVFNLSDWATLEDFVAAIADGLGRPRPSLRLPETPVRAATRALSGVPGFPLTTTRIDALTNRSHYPDEKISSLLGFRHNVPVLEGIRSLAAQRRTS
jgi:nucleoside-diphosphate-sugar epimerase